MNPKRISLGYDLRTNPSLLKVNPSQEKQSLAPGVWNPISADPSVWLAPEGAEYLRQGVLPHFFNPLYLANSLNQLADEYTRQGISTAGLWPISITTCETNIVALVERYGSGYFEDHSEEAELLSQGWRSMGFDVVDFDGLISGLKGCGYVEPARSQLRTHFGGSLNEHGLLPDVATAAQFAEVRGLEIRDHSPFVVVGVLTNEPSS